MPPTNAVAKLLSLFEGSSHTDDLEPSSSKFKALKLNTDRLDNDWGRRRLRGVRLAAFLLKNDSETLHGLVCTDELATYQETVRCLKREALQLKKSAALVEKATKRVSAVIARCEREKAERRAASAAAVPAGEVCP